VAQTDQVHSKKREGSVAESYIGEEEGEEKKHPDHPSRLKTKVWLKGEEKGRARDGIAGRVRFLMTKVMGTLGSKMKCIN